MKRHWLKTLISVVLIVLMLGGLIVFASGSSPIYLMSVNNMVLQMSYENMPLFFGNELYIPYIMLSPQVTSTDLGVWAQYSASKGTLTVTNGSRTVVFDIRRNTVEDHRGVSVDAMALVRNSMVYIPLDWLCEDFEGVAYSLSATPYGILVRLTSQSASVLSDEEFIKAADFLLRKNAEDYQKSQRQTNPPETQSPSVPPVTPPTTPTPTPPPTTSPSVPPEPVAVADIYPAFRWDVKSNKVVELLEEEGWRGLFLFSNQELMEQDDLVRRLVARGHQVGLVLQGSDVEECLSQLIRGREMMKAICYSPLLIVSADELSETDLDELKDLGCAVWRADLNGEGEKWKSLSKQLRTDRPNHVQLPCNSDGIKILTEFLSGVKEEKYQMYQVLAPML